MAFLELSYFLYDKKIEKYLVELKNGKIQWIGEGDFGFNPCRWTFTEKEIVEKFGEENLKYKISISKHSKMLIKKQKKRPI